MINVRKKMFLEVNEFNFMISLLLLVWISGVSNFAYAVSPRETTFVLQSSAFENESSIPAKYTCQGSDISPPLSWKGAPANTKSFALIVDDPDAPGGTWNHWLIFNIPPETHALSENLTSLPQGALMGKNSWGNNSYNGPCPPQGVHRYFFKLYALDAVLTLSKDASKNEIEKAMKENSVGKAELMGKYKKIQ